MRVIMLIDRYAPIWGGAENQLRQLIERLNSCDMVCRVVTRRWTPDLPGKGKVDGVDVFRIGIPGKHLFATLTYAVSVLSYLLVNRSKWDIVHTHGAAALGVLGASAACLCRKKSVVKIATAGKIGQMKKIPFGETLLGILRKASAVVALSKEIEGELVSIEIAPNVIRSIQNGVDTNHFFPASPEQKVNLRKKLAIPPDAVVSVFCGRIVERKGLDLILVIWEEIVKEHPDNYLCIAGSGNMQKDSKEEECREYVRKHSLNNVMFLGEVKDPLEVLQAADIFLFPSRREGFPNALLEAMAAELPVVANDIGGVADLVTDNVSGLLVRREDTAMLCSRIRRLAGSKELRAKLGREARRSVTESFSIELISSKYESLYREIL